MQTELVRTKLIAQVKIRQLKELEIFNSLRLSVVATAEVLADIAADVAIDVTVEAIASRLGYRSRGLDTN